jgi:hypothetical protein
MVAVGVKPEHRRDAYDTMGSVTCVALRPNESIIGVPPVLPKDGWQCANDSAGRSAFPALDGRCWRETGNTGETPMIPWLGDVRGAKAERKVS